MLKLSFHGAAGTVTGSRHLLQTMHARVLIDSGLFQGRKEVRERNWHPPGFEPAQVDMVVLTHAHIDHSGYLPRLVKEGFRGPIYATPATADLANLLLRDSAMIQEEDAEYANKKGFSKHRPARPLYTVKDAERAISRIEVIEYGEWGGIPGGARFRFRHAGHIIGSGQVDVDVPHSSETWRLLFSGDVGRYDAPLVPDPAAPEPCDVLVIESTYGDRTHPATDIHEQLADALRAILETKGTLLVPAFAVGRSQQLIYLLHEVMENDPALAMAVHLDSPMAVDTTKIYGKYPEESGLEEVRLKSGSNPIYGKNVFLHRTRDDSMRLNKLDGPRVIISSSGMMAGGRVLHHLKRLLPDERNLVMLAGYQAYGTRGWRMQQGERTIRIHGQDIPVHCKTAKISGLSAHADADQLMRWVKGLAPPRKTFVTHGDGDAATTLARRLEAELGFSCAVPGHGDEYEL